LREGGPRRGEPRGAPHAGGPVRRQGPGGAGHRRARARVAGHGGRPHRDHRHQRQDHDDVADGRVAEGAGAADARGREHRHAALGACPRFPGRRPRGGRGVELPAREHGPVPPSGGGRPQHHTRSSGPAREPRAVHGGQGQHPDEPEHGRLRGAQLRRPPGGRPRLARGGPGARVQSPRAAPARGVRPRRMDRRQAQRSRGAHLPRRRDRPARPAQRRERARGHRVRPVDGDGAAGDPPRHRRVPWRRAPDRTGPGRSGRRLLQRLQGHQRGLDDQGAREFHRARDPDRRRQGQGPGLRPARGCRARPRPPGDPDRRGPGQAPRAPGGGRYRHRGRALHGRSGAARQGRRARGRRGAPLAGLCLLRHVPELRASGPRVQGRRAGAPGLMPRKLTPDLWLFAVVVALCSVGVVMVYSASAIIAADRFHDPFFFLKKQFFWALLGVACLWAALRVDYRRLERLVVPLLVVSFVLLVLVLVPPFGQAINGTRRWFRGGPVSFQPVELAKFSLVLYMAAFLARRQALMSSFGQGLVPPLLVAGLMAGLTILQPDLGNSLALIILTLALAYLAGARVTHMLAIGAAALPVVGLLIALKPYRLRRFLAFLNPWDDPQGSGFQIIQSFLALGSGGWFGLGLGESKQKLFYLPEPYTDFIFAIIGEELGLVGAALVVGLFAVLIWRGLRIGLRAPDAFSAYLALGLTIMLATQTVVNLGVVTGALPTKGLPLPFVSFGGSALLMTMFSAGVLLNISQHAGNA